MPEKPEHPPKLFWEGLLPIQLHAPHRRILPCRICRISPRGEETGPARDKLRVPGEEEDGKCAEQDEDGLFSKSVEQTHRGLVTLGSDRCPLEGWP